MPTHDPPGAGAGRRQPDADPAPRRPAPPARRAMILAAGLGKRLRPLTGHLPKPLAPLLGRPLLDVVVDAVAAAGAREIAINTHHLPEVIEAHVQASWPAGAAGTTRRIALFHEPEILGTGGALANARAFLERDDCFILHNGDVVTDLDLDALVDAHTRHDALATLALVDWAPVNTVLLGEDGVVRDLGDHLAVTPTARDRYLTYSGVAVLSRQLLRYIAPAGASSLVTALVAAMREREDAVRGVAPSGIYWNDVGTIERYLAAHRDLIERFAARQAAATGAPPAEQARWPAYWPVPDLSGDGVAGAADAELAPDAVIRGFASLGEGSRIGRGAVLEDCVVLSGTTVADGARHRRAVLGPGWQATADRALGLRDALATEKDGAVAACLRNAGFGEATRVTPITGHGSDRRFWRLADGDRAAVLMRTPPEDSEFDRFVAIARFLAGADLGGPTIVAVEPEQHAVIMEDLGDVSLHRLVRTPSAVRDAVTGEVPEIDAVYRQVIDLLVDLQTRGSQLAAACSEASDRRLDHETLRWETSYFREQFLEGLVGMPAPWLTGLDDDFHRLARAVLEQPVVLIHRDFQSQNILLADGRIRLVDVQGMRLGPLGYDPVSLLFDAYVELDQARVASLGDYYREQLAERGGPRLDAERWHAFATLAGLQRTMQALGAFAYLSRVKGKPEFRRHVPAALRRLEAGLGDLRAGDFAPGPLERLEDVVADLR